MVIYGSYMHKFSVVRIWKINYNDKRRIPTYLLAYQPSDISALQHDNKYRENYNSSL